MFTGIVTHLGTVRAALPAGPGDGGRGFVIEPGFDPAGLALGASVAHSGVCLTVTGVGGGTYRVHASGETLARTALGRWAPGTRVNLERSLRLGDELGGHLVFGHVDGVGRVLATDDLGSSWRLEVEAPPALLPLLAVKGSVAVDGVSLTVTEAGADRFATVVIPHTRAVTTLADRRPGDHVNLEIDMLARYVARALAFPPQGPNR